ncbi:UNVERIFIED_CONTAM: hypothetical protein GTU68_061851 [Idotea baltica]|nr:hypothetical protein [Idotea baltica]
MKLSIRLQNKGKKNHPLWWIVIAPYRKNIFGRYIEHVGIWSPREGKHLKRSITLNIPRIKYWMSHGAIPTFKVHKFLSMWNILPEQWYYKSNAYVDIRVTIRASKNHKTRIIANKQTKNSTIEKKKATIAI